MRACQLKTLRMPTVLNSYRANVNILLKQPLHFTAALGFATGHYIIL